MRVRSWRAVATLDDAKAEILAFCFHPRGNGAGIVVPLGVGGEVAALPESGGTVGPLPDGTTISVEPVMWADLLAEAAADSGITKGMPASEWEPRVIAAFNAKQSTYEQVKAAYPPFEEQTRMAEDAAASLEEE